MDVVNAEQAAAWDGDEGNHWTGHPSTAARRRPGPLRADRSGCRQTHPRRSGVQRVDLGEVNEPIRFGADADEAFSFVRGVGFVRGVLDGLDDTTKTRALETLRRTLAEHGSGDGVQFGSAAWLITARRV